MVTWCNSHLWSTGALRSTCAYPVTKSSVASRKFSDSKSKGDLRPPSDGCRIIPHTCFATSPNYISFVSCYNTNTSLCLRKEMFNLSYNVVLTEAQKSHFVSIQKNEIEYFYVQMSTYHNISLVSYCLLFPKLHSFGMLIDRPQSQFMFVSQ